MTLTSSLLISFFLLVTSFLPAQMNNKKTPTHFKVVGYYFLNDALRDTLHADSNYVFLNKITHLNIAFINPDSTGNFNQNLAIDSLIQKAHEKNVKVLASIAGGGPHPYYKTFLHKNERNVFITHLTALIKKYHFDGIDVDLEGGDIDSNYANFITELSASLKPINKLLTAAIATAYKDLLPDEALAKFDFVNVMSYDRTGPWNPNNPGQHSPYTMAVEDLDYWQNIRQIAKDKLVLGLPFYGYGFGASDSGVISMTYKEIVSDYNNNNVGDTLSLPGNVTMYYNNIATIKAKTKLAIEKAGGVMIWQLLGDAADDKSLLNTIDEAVHKNQKKAKRIIR